MPKNHSTAFTLTPTPVRLAFPQLTTGKPDKRGKTKFGATLLIPKSDPAALAVFKGLVQEVLKASLAPGLPLPAKLGIRDGDIPNSAGNIPDGYKGHWVVGCTSGFAVSLYDKAAKKILDESVFPPGCWVIAQVNAFWYDTDGNKGVSFGIAAVQFHHEDARLGGGGAPAPAFVPGAAQQPAPGGTGDSLNEMFK